MGGEGGGEGRGAIPLNSQTSLVGLDAIPRVIAKCNNVEVL